MTPENQRIALAKWAGWKPVTRDFDGIEVDGWISPHGLIATPPEYLHDLNAVHELEEKLKITAEAMQFAVELSRLVGKPFQPARELGLWEGWKLAHATADQRCEALLKTLGLWEA